jgi:hypothetical protein
MANVTATPTLLTDPGFLFRAPIGSTIPAMTVVGSVFADTWPVAWVNLGATADGTDFDYVINASPVLVAEFADPVKQVVVTRSGSMAFELMNYTATNLKNVLNGATTVVTGTTTTTLTRITPPAVGTEVRSMIGFESLDATVRIIAYQCLNTSPIKMLFKKAPSATSQPAIFSFEVPSTGIPFEAWTAGLARA